MSTKVSHRCCCCILFSRVVLVARSKVASLSMGQNSPLVMGDHGGVTWPLYSLEKTVLVVVLWYWCGGRQSMTTHLNRIQTTATASGEQLLTHDSLTSRFERGAQTRESLH